MGGSETKSKADIIPEASESRSFSLEDLENKTDTSVDQILYAQSLDLIGRRDIHSDMFEKSTELVHRIQLQNIRSDLQTVKTDFITITYQLELYLSVGPLGFNKKIRTIDLTFINTPDDAVVGSWSLRKRFRALKRTLQDLDYVLMLPYSKVSPD